MKNLAGYKKLWFVLFTMVLVLVFVLLISGRAMSQEKQVVADREGLQKLEQEYIREIRDYLAEKGYANSGVNLTCVTEADGDRNYQVAIYHKRIEKLDEIQKKELFEEIEELAFCVSGCDFQINFLG